MNFRECIFIFCLGFQVTGDTNVFAGKISVKCFLNYPVNVTLEEQRSMKSLAMLPKVEKTDKLHEFPVQRFVLPEDYVRDAPFDVEIPKYFLARLVKRLETSVFTTKKQSHSFK